MKFSGKSCENFRKFVIKKKQEKFWENCAIFEKISICQFYRKYGFLQS